MNFGCPSATARYGVALTITGLALLGTFVAEPFRDKSPFLLSIVAVTIAVWYGGLGPGLLSTALAGLGIAFLLFFPPAGLQASDGLLHLSAFILAAFLITSLNEVRLRRQDAIRRFNETLERKVSERTMALNAKNQALQQSEGRLRLLVDSVNDYAIFMLDTEGRVISWNRGAERIKGYRAEEILGRHFSIFYRPEDIAAGKTEEELRIAAERGRYEDEGWRVRKDGTVFWASVVVSAVRDEDGRLRGFAKVTQDMTERKKAEEALRQSEEVLRRQAGELSRSNADLERFAYVASHDLQEPLRMVASYVQLLARRYKGKLDADADAFIGYAVDGVQRMQRLIKDLLAYARLGAGGKVFRATDCETVFSHALANLQDAIGKSRAALTHDPLPTVMADETQMVQLFQNLIGNALKFHGNERPSIHVSATRRMRPEEMRGEWIFSVQDNGIGIEPQYRERIFEIFERLHDAGSYSGTGIGLALCRKIVEGHGGRIWVESAAGAGAIFYFTIPDAA
jgi:PAS domain S-box-containing protein